MHNGILFLDEMGEFPAFVLDALRQPLEEGVVRVARARASVSFPARFLLVGAMNPCPCGDGGPPGSCRCTEAARVRYARRLSGPLLDRFDIRIPVFRPEVDELLGAPMGEPSAAVAFRVAQARARAAERGVASNARIPATRIEACLALTPPARRVLEHKLRTAASPPGASTVCSAWPARWPTSSTPTASRRSTCAGRSSCGSSRPPSGWPRCDAAARRARPNWRQ